MKGEEGPSDVWVQVEEMRALYADEIMGSGRATPENVSPKELTECRFGGLTLRCQSTETIATTP